MVPRQPGTPSTARSSTAMSFTSAGASRCRCPPYPSGRRPKASPPAGWASPGRPQPCRPPLPPPGPQAPPPRPRRPHSRGRPHCGVRAARASAAPRRAACRPLLRRLGCQGCRRSRQTPITMAWVPTLLWPCLTPASASSSTHWRTMCQWTALTLSRSSWRRSATTPSMASSMTSTRRRTPTTAGASTRCCRATRCGAGGLRPLSWWPAAAAGCRRA
mmetsp:Transcript_35269/g.99854  ORF Transcript_35269/g.99854 Transcript_35269/m.99854 type:complete len:217 (+) Transcript_35269:903-1553(+)